MELIRRFTVTTPAGTAKAAPQIQAMNFDPSEVLSIEVLVPPGPRGELGFKIGQAGNQFIPYSPDDYFVTDDEKKVFSTEGANTSGAWQMISYNTGAFPHTVEVTFTTRLIDTRPTEPIVPISNADLSSPPSNIIPLFPAIVGA